MQISKENPYQLTKKQHAIPAQIIKQWYNKKGNVFVKFHDKEFYANSRNDCFVVNFCWTQHGEIHGTCIENRFHKMIEEIKMRDVFRLCDKCYRVASEYYNLLNIKFKYAYRVKMDNIKLPNTLFSGYREQWEKELLWSKCYSFCDVEIDEDGKPCLVFPKQDWITMQILGMYDYRFIRWYMIKSKERLLLPDTYGAYEIININPHTVLISENLLNKFLPTSEAINNIALQTKLNWIVC